MKSSGIRPSPTPSSTGSSTTPIASNLPERACERSKPAAKNLTASQTPDPLNPSAKTRAHDHGTAAHDALEHAPTIAWNRCPRSLECASSMAYDATPACARNTSSHSRDTVSTVSRSARTASVMAARSSTPIS
jgi:hypothetical protein